MKILSNPFFIAGSAGFSFIGILELILFAQAGFDLENMKAMSPASTISLCTGALTAAALSGIYAQFKSSENAAKERAINTSLNLDALHGDFNTSEMRTVRKDAYKLLRQLKYSEQDRQNFIKCWFQDDREITVKDPATNKTFDDYSNAISVILAFYVRLETRLRLADQPSNSNWPKDCSNYIGQFFWDHWRDSGVLELIAASKEGGIRKIDEFEIVPYYVEPLEALNKRYLAGLGVQPKRLKPKEEKRAKKQEDKPE
ncbi:hypothetical protein [Hyphomonas atlantica corrig.]|uniref:hypothetical protein n=1 Tax=Hyphomonas atlantica TaxID=1280948 RepID=UPI002352A9EE|nr:hypothetical protein [Hyphomonas atlantica]